MPSKEKKPPRVCEHVNLAVICKDCASPVDPRQFEHDQGPRNEKLEKDGMTKIIEIPVEQTIRIDGLDRDFVPVFDVQKGDVIVLYRKK